MTLNNNPKIYPFVLPPDFVKMIDEVLAEKVPDAEGGTILNFRDPDYSAERGGFHPVEICVDANGVLQYVTDFAYFGRPPMVELGIELDWSFQYGTFRQFDDFHDIAVGQSIFHLYMENFCAYHEMGVFNVIATPL